MNFDNDLTFARVYQGPSYDGDENEHLEEVDSGGEGHRLGGDAAAAPPSLTPSQAAAEAALRRFSASKPSNTPETGTRKPNT